MLAGISFKVVQVALECYISNEHSPYIQFIGSVVGFLHTGLQVMARWKCRWLQKVMSAMNMFHTTSCVFVNVRVSCWFSTYRFAGDGSMVVQMASEGYVSNEHVPYNQLCVCKC